MGNKKLLVLLMGIILAVFNVNCDNTIAKATGNLVVPMSVDLFGQYCLYTVSVDKGDSSIYLTNKNYDELRFPIQNSLGLFCVGRNSKNEYYSLLLVEGEKLSEVYSSIDEINFPVIHGSNVVFIEGDDDSSYLYSFSLTEKNKEQIINQIADKKSKPIINKDGSIIFVSKKESKYIIKKINKNGTVQDVVEGRYPLWLEEGKKLIYYSSRRLFLYNFGTQNKTVIAKDINLIETPVLSPNKRYLALYEYDKIASFGGETSEFLSITTVNGDRKVHIGAYNFAKRKLQPNGLMWLHE